MEPLVAQGVERDRITVLGNWQKSDSQGNDPSITAHYRKRFAPSGETLVLHAGSIGIKQGLDQLVEAAEASIDSNLRFVLVGQGSERARLEALAGSLNNFEFADPVPARDISSMLAAADVLVLSQSRRNLDMSFPSKLGSYLGAGVPIVACVPPAGAVARYLEETEAGLVIDCQFPQRLLSAIESLERHRELKVTLNKNAAKALEDWHAGELLDTWTDTLVGAEQVDSRSPRLPIP